MNIVDYFDPYNMEHIRAYRHLQKEGTWSRGFIPEGMEFPNGWHFLVLNKLADAWINSLSI